MQRGGILYERICLKIGRVQKRNEAISAGLLLAAATVTVVVIPASLALLTVLVKALLLAAVWSPAITFAVFKGSTRCPRCNAFIVRQYKQPWHRIQYLCKNCKVCWITDKVHEDAPVVWIG